ncbi:P-loop containing nucleoside triphosphate hydrolase protein [Cladochytrium replicatum]|nr:P-loop containing nucleoside triphosphate hydrolase protein [Cladochytrium replicatum]
MSNAAVYLYLKPVPVESNVVYRSNFSIDDAANTLTLEPKSDVSTGDPNYMITNAKRAVYHFDGIVTQTMSSNLSNDQNIPDLVSKTYYSAVDGLLKKWISGYNVTLSVIGLTGSGKTELLDGPGPDRSVTKCGFQSRGLLAFCAEQIFENISVHNEDNQTIVNRIQVQAFELLGELIRDLIEPFRDGLKISNDNCGAKVVQGLSSHNVTNCWDLIDILQNAKKSKLSNFDSVASNNSFQFYVFKLYRNTLVNSKPTYELVSKFMIVEFCGAERFFDNPTRLIMSEGLYVSRSVLALWSALKTFGRPLVTQPFFDFSQASATELLSDLFGGNCYASFILTMDPSPTNLNIQRAHPEFDIKSEVSSIEVIAKSLSQSWNKSILDMGDILRSLVMFPIKGDLNSRKLLQRLLVQNKSQIEFCNRDVEVFKKNEFVTMNAEDQCEELSKMIVALRKENSKLKEDGEIVSERLSDLAMRLANLTEVKSELETSYLKCEEEKLTFHRALLDSEIANSKYLDESDKRIEELSQQVGMRDSEIKRLQMKIEEITQQDNNLKISLENEIKFRNDVSTQLKELQVTYDDLLAGFTKQTSKCEELESEIINLISGKKSWIVEKEEQLQLIERLNKHNEYLQRKLESVTLYTYGQKAEMWKQKEETDFLNAKLLDNLGEVNQEINVKEKKHSDSLQQKKRELKDIEEESEKQISLLESEKQLLQKSNSELKQKLEALTVERVIKEEILNSNNTLEKRLKSELQRISEKYQSLVGNYRSKLEHFIQEITQLRKNPHESGIKIYVKYLFEEILQSYIVHEKSLSDHLQASEEEIQSLWEQVEKYQNLEAELAKDVLSDIKEKRGHGEQETVAMNSSMKLLQKQFKEFILNSQSEWEKERSALLVRCATAEELVEKLELELANV